jgi:hypothetical protein
MVDHLQALNRLYQLGKEEAKRDISSDSTGRLIHDLALNTIRFLRDECDRVALKSLVPNKSYFSFSRRGTAGIVARPANAALFNLDPDVVSAQWQAWWEGKLPHADLARMSYTVALAPCLAMELFDRQNKKQPATYFEYLIGHIFAKAIGTSPFKRATLTVQGHTVRMTMDFLFNMKNGVRHIHLPVKMSTRERVVQAWAHQRLLDAAFGQNAYRGIMILFSETKLDSKKLEVVEICVPDQWLAYQLLLSKMDRIYYFDVPAVYEGLSARYPDILPIKNFGEFFIEKEAVLAA